MQERVFVYDPTASDVKSKVRGVGRYMQLLKETFGNEFRFSPDLRDSAVQKPDIFVNPFLNTLAFPLLYRRIAPRQVAVIHDLIPMKYPNRFPTGLKGKLASILNNVLMNLYDIVVTDSHASKRDIVSLLRIPEQKVKVAYPCLPGRFFDPETGEGSLKIPPQPYSLYVGDATWNKNLANIARAVQLSNIPCVFVGRVFQETRATGAALDNPWQRELKTFLEIAGEDKRFIFPGFISDRDLAALYRNAAINILVSRDEGFGFSYVEASALGCPSILADQAIFREIALDAAVFVDGENPQALADAVRRFAKDRDRDGIRIKALERSKFFNLASFRTQFTDAIS